MGEGGCEPGYFLKEMAWWEVQRYVSGVRRRDRVHWENTRQHAYWILSALGAKMNDEDDLMRLPWREERKQTEVSDTEYEQLQQMMKAENERNEK